MNLKDGIAKKIFMVVLLCVAGATSLVVFQNCAKTKIGDLKNSDATNQQAFALLNGTQLISISNANEAQCPAGGKIYSVYTDLNSNFLLDSGEEVLSSQSVCNGSTGAAGQNGLNSMISMNRVTVELTACASLSGVQLSSGMDSNSSGALDADEITHTEILCDGMNGEVGASGPAGANGHNAVFSIVPANTETCPQGGSVIFMALDTENLGYYSEKLPEQQSAVVCNGTNGMDAEPSAYQIVDVIRPCGETVANKEILLLLKNGQILASVSDNVNGYNTRLSFVVDGSYMNTDPSKCQFKISTANKIRSISWAGAVQKSWPMP